MNRQSSFSSTLQIAASIVCILNAALLAANVTSGSAFGAANGEQIFKENCAACHANGGNIVDPKKPLKGSAKLASKDSFKAYLLKPSGAMQPFPKIANNAGDLEALYTYCKSLK